MLAHPVPGDPQQELLRVVHILSCTFKPQTEGFQEQIADCAQLVASQEKEGVKEFEAAFIAAPL